jgi:sugar phosphate isomerase/epimerase
LQAPLVCIDLGPLPAVGSAGLPRPNISKEQAGLIIIPSAAPEPPPPPVTIIPPDPAFVSQVNSVLMEVGNYADRYRAMIAFSSSLSSVASLRKALADANCQWFGIDLDPVAMLREEESADEVFSAIGPLIRHVRGRDAALGADKRTKPAVVGKGDTNWPQLLALLDEAGYSDSITLDPVELSDRPSAALAGAKYLRTL